MAKKVGKLLKAALCAKCRSIIQYDENDISTTQEPFLRFVNCPECNTPIFVDNRPHFQVIETNVSTIVKYKIEEL